MGSSGRPLPAIGGTTFEDRMTSKPDPRTWPTLSEWAAANMAKAPGEARLRKLAKRMGAEKIEGRWRVPPGAKDPRRPHGGAGHKSKIRA